MSDFFSAEGPLSGSSDFEFRPQQQEMAALVGKALVDSRPLLVEAGTGVGKSLAYLVPALTHASENCKKAIISTHTINLQEQLIRKDIPLATKLLDVEVKAVLDEHVQPQSSKNSLQPSLLMSPSQMLTEVQ